MGLSDDHTRARRRSMDESSRAVVGGGAMRIVSGVTGPMLSVATRYPPEPPVTDPNARAPADAAVASGARRQYQSHGAAFRLQPADRVPLAATGRSSPAHQSRKPRDYPVSAPGDLVQLDTLDIRPEPGIVLKQFTARDVVSRWDVLHLASRATAGTATQALAAVLARMPFPVHAVQVDGGSEFMAAFEAACQQRGVRLFVLPPRSPKLNGCVERANRTHTEEFYECTTAPPTVAALTPALRRWEHVSNTLRPHQALGYRTPRQFLEDWLHDHTRKEDLSRT